MSMLKEYYVIAGYDLTGLKTEKFYDWKWTDEGVEYTCNQVKGNIQLFDDPMSGNHLYFGYVLASGDEYEFNTVSINLKDIRFHHIQKEVKSKLLELKNNGVITSNLHYIPEFKIIIFEECR